MIGRQAGEGALDLAAVQRDDDLLGVLAARGVVDDGDPVARLLAALADDVDEGLAELLVSTDPLTTAGATWVESDRLAELLVSTDPLTTAGATWVSTDVLPELEPDSAPRGRRAARRAAAVAVALAATLSVSGVAAAVTGDPLAPYKAVGGALSWGEDDLPETAAPIAHLNKRLARARAAIAHGEVDGAQSRLDAIRAALADADLKDGQRAAFERKLDRLEAALADAGTRGRAGEKPAGGGADGQGKKGEPPGQADKGAAADEDGTPGRGHGADKSSNKSTDKSSHDSSGRGSDTSTDSGAGTDTGAGAESGPGGDSSGTGGTHDRQPKTTEPGQKAKPAKATNSADKGGAGQGHGGG